MWKLAMRGARGTPFTDQGSYASIVEAAEAICKMEDDLNGWVFFRVPVNALDVESTSDAAVLSHLEYQSTTRFYELTRSAD